MFKAKKSEENQIPLMESNTKLQEDNYLKNNYFSRTVEENDTLKKDLIKLRKQELAFKKIIIEMEGKLDFYIKNSPVQPDFDNSSQKKEILGLLENFNDFADKANNEIDKDAKISEYEFQIKNYKMKIKDLLKDLRVCQAKLKDSQDKKFESQVEKNPDFQKLKPSNFNEKKVVSNIKSIQTSINYLKNDLETFKNFTKNTIEAFEIEPIFEKLSFLIRGNSNDIDKLKNEYVKEIQQKKQLFNFVQEMKGNIRVFCRVRPLLKDEKECCLNCQNDQIRVENKLEDKVKFFEFDRVFSSNINQTEFFEEIKPLIVSFLDGYNVSIFAYGQTGSGKTYTMEGPENDKGVNSRTIYELFNVIKERNQTYSYSLKISLLEIYNENINDLFSMNQSKKLEIKQGPLGNYVPDLTILSVTSPLEVESFLEMGIKNRSIASTNMNEHSSRSHLIYTIHLSGINLIENITFNSKLHLIDLAGSERLSKSIVSGETQREAIFINKSLSALGDVIAAKISKNSHIPFRNSTLTYFLQNSLSGDSKTLMILQVSPAINSLEESQCSLTFASRVRCVELGPAKKGLLKKK